MYKKIVNRFNLIIEKLHLRQHIKHKSDRVVLYSALNTISNSMFAIFKIIVGLLFWSMWFLIFGGYYIVLLTARIYFLYRYTKIRKSNLDFSERLAIEKHYLREGGLLYSLLGFLLASLSGYMYVYGYDENYNQSVVLLIALMGFTKIISSVVGWVKARSFHSPIILFLKSLNIADGLVAIVMTQYVLLSYEHSASASSATGLFGMGIGLFLMIGGIAIVVRAHFYKQV